MIIYRKGNLKVIANKENIVLAVMPGPTRLTTIDYEGLFNLYDSAYNQEAKIKKLEDQLEAINGDDCDLCQYYKDDAKQLKREKMKMESKDMSHIKTWIQENSGLIEKKLYFNSVVIIQNDMKEQRVQLMDNVVAIDYTEREAELLKFAKMKTKLSNARKAMEDVTVNLCHHYKKFVNDEIKKAFEGE